MDELRRRAIAREIPHLRRYALAISRDPDVADDLVQDSLERALRKSHLWRREGSLRSWMFRILYTVFLNSRQNRRPAAGEIPWEENGDGAWPAVEAPLEARLECMRIAEALDRLPVSQRDAIVLVALEEFSYEEAAAILNVPVGTLRSRIARGRETLRLLREPMSQRATLRRVR